MLPVLPNFKVVLCTSKVQITPANGANGHQVKSIFPLQMLMDYLVQLQLVFFTRHMQTPEQLSSLYSSRLSASSSADIQFQDSVFQVQVSIHLSMFDSSKINLIKNLTNYLLHLRQPIRQLIWSKQNDQTGCDM
jgi:hypothetical protein